MSRLVSIGRSSFCRAVTVLAVAIALGAGCSDSTGPDGLDGTDGGTEMDGAGATGGGSAGTGTGGMAGGGGSSGMGGDGSGGAAGASGSDAAVDGGPVILDARRPDDGSAPDARYDGGPDAPQSRSDASNPDAKPLDSARGDADAGDGDPSIVDCGDLSASLESGSCAVTAGSPASSQLYIEGTILTGERVYEHCGVLVDRSGGPNGTIVCAGCGCASQATDAMVLTCPGGVVSPGLVNAHDHLGYTLHHPVAPPDDERYDHRHDWRRGTRQHTELVVTSDPSPDAVLYGELRMLIGGATSIAGSAGGSEVDGLLRNLDSNQYNGGLGDWRASYSTFPLGDATGILAASGCSSYFFDNPSRLDERVYLPHIAEGIDAEANNEFACLSTSLGDAGARDYLQSNTSIVHGIGLGPADISEVATEGARLVWSPRTNLHLYGQTAPVVSYDLLGVPIGLGTDWVATGSMNMLRELACADDLNTHHFGGHFSDRDLWAMATRGSAEALGAGDLLGRLEEGYVADLVVFRGTPADGYRAVIDAEPADVLLALRGGVPLYGSEALIDAVHPLPGDCETIDVCDSPHKACLAETGTTVASLATSFPDAYPLVACGTPPSEPSCVPFRPGEHTGMTSATDADGDGIDDAVDNCPTIFNAPRPLEGDVQGDADGDGIGDACDPAPLAGP